MAKQQPRLAFNRRVTARLAMLAFVLSLGSTGCGAVIDSALGYPESCTENCHDTYQACLVQVGTPDANHYCLNRRTQCIADCRD